MNLETKRSAFETLKDQEVVIAITIYDAVMDVMDYPCLIFIGRLEGGRFFIITGDGYNYKEGDNPKVLYRELVTKLHSEGRLINPKAKKERLEGTALHFWKNNLWVSEGNTNLEVKND